ncbi:hypothetical protein scyTo_0025619, partial [Scyliorhinus torazame]|nr:hypothetical protein [Scyliorhinus torazame]
AERETKLKLDKVAEIKKVTTKMMAVKNDIVKFEETLKDYQIYRDFLIKLSPKEWKEEKEKKKKETQTPEPPKREKSSDFLMKTSITPPLLRREYSAPKLPEFIEVILCWINLF